ncbi:N/A [soil metagenome]
MSKLLVLALASVLLASVAAACNLTEDEEAGPTPTPTNVPIEEQDPAVIIERAVARWDETESAHFLLEIDGATYLDDDEQIQLAGAEGDLARPQSVEALASVAISLVTLDVSLIFIGDEAYMTDFLTGNWGAAPDDFSYNPALLLSQTDGLGPVLQALEDPEVVGRETIAGTDTVHIRGTVEQEMIDDMTSGAIQGDQIRVDIWFDGETLDVVRIALAEPDDGTSWIITLSDHNEPVSIEAPDV